jgi:uncharacterized membrane protein YraQ (UPF0718 family)
MSVATLVLVVIAGAMALYAWREGGDRLHQGLLKGWGALRRTMPTLLVAFVIVGYVNVLNPQEAIRYWLGPESGLRGLLIGELAGMLLPGGPYVVFPLIAAIFGAGAGIGPTLAMITSWASLALLSASFELPFLGWRFTLVRYCVALPVPFLTGLLGMWLFPL